MKIWNWLMLKISSIGGSPRFRKVADSPIWAGSEGNR